MLLVYCQLNSVTAKPNEAFLNLYGHCFDYMVSREFAVDLSCKTEFYNISLVTTVTNLTTSVKYVTSVTNVTTSTHVTSVIYSLSLPFKFCA